MKKLWRNVLITQEKTPKDGITRKSTEESLSKKGLIKPTNLRSLHLEKNEWFYKAVSLVSNFDEWKESQKLAEDCYTYGLNYKYLMNKRLQDFPVHLKWFVTHMKSPTVFFSPHVRIRKKPKLFKKRSKYDVILGKDLNVVGFNYNCITERILQRWIFHLNRCHYEYPDNPEEWDLYANLLKTLAEFEDKVNIKRLPENYISSLGGDDPVIFCKEPS